MVGVDKMWEEKCGIKTTSLFWDSRRFTGRWGTLCRVILVQDGVHGQLYFDMVLIFARYR